MSEVRREIPAALVGSWESATRDPSAISALGASRSLYEQLTTLQAALVEEAMNSGAAWEDIGAALGTSRQAAWARFRHVVESTEEGAERMREQIGQLSKQLTEESKSLQRRLRSFDEEWRREKKLLQDQLREFDKRRTEERKALQGEIQRSADVLREEVRRLGQAPTAS